MDDFFRWLSAYPLAAVVVVILAVVIVMFVLLVFGVAFFQGRSISFWPPKIGEKPNRSPKQPTSQSRLPLPAETIRHIVISANDAENMDYLCKYVLANRIGKARLIQYSGDKIKRVVQALLEHSAKVELLLHHPADLLLRSDEPLSQFQLDKMAVFQRDVNTDFKNRKNLVIRYYKEPASIRAVKLDDAFLSMGWYTYSTRDGMENTNWLYGHSNVALVVHLDQVNARDLVATFDKVFRTLWKSSYTQEEAQKEIEQLLGRVKKEQSAG